MEFHGNHLKVERELRNLSIEDVAEFTKIRKDFLKTIEEDRFDLLPSPFYAKWFLTAYARYLGLDTNDFLIRYQTYLKSLTTSQPPELQRQALTSKKRVRPWLFFLFIFAITLFVTFFIYYTCHEHSEWTPPSCKAIPSPSIPSLLQGQEKAEIQITLQAVKEDIPKLKDVEIKDAVPEKSPPLEALEADIGGRDREKRRSPIPGRKVLGIHMQ